MNRRHFVRTGATTLAAGLMSSRLPALPMRRARALPSAAQLQWQRDELAMFLHFGVNTFTDREWGDGKESPAIFNPTNLDARQWARAAKAGGFRSVILTAKHHDGFCLWPSRTTEHTVAKSPFRGGSGDVVREFVNACRAEGLRPGLYLSPWDRNNAAYGNSAMYNDLYSDQLSELLTQYGPLAEVWFDGANGEGPNGKRQVYDWPRTFAIVRRHQPDAVIFSDAGPDVRWCGNEKGFAGDPNWSAVDPSIVTYPGASGEGIIEALQHGSSTGTVWRPAECDTSIRKGWFYHPADDDAVRTADDLVDLYHLSVGRNAKLLLNVPPTRDGLLHDTDVARLTAFKSQLNTLNEPYLSTGAEPTWKVTGPRTAELELTLARPVAVSAARMAEDITKGQLVARYSLLGTNGVEWRVLATGTTIGYARLQRFAPMTVRRLKLMIEDAIDAPEQVTLTV